MIKCMLGAIAFGALVALLGAPSWASSAVASMTYLLLSICEDLEKK